MKQVNVIHSVVRLDRCSGCGVCAGVCPGRFLTIAEASNGDLVAQWRTGPCPSNCGLCVEVCPFAKGVHDPRPLNQAIFNAKECPATHHFHEDAGYYENALVGYSEVHRPESASGGLLTWTLEQLLAQGEVNRVAIVVCEPDEIDGHRFLFKAAQTTEEIRGAAGSVYHPVEISHIVRQITRQPGVRWAITGVPCLCAAIRNAMQRIPAVRRAVRYVFGLACGMYQNRYYTDLLCLASGVPPKEAVSIRYRLKAREGLASNFQFQATRRDGRRGRPLEYSGLPSFLGSHAFFRVNACNYCKDVFAEAADACFMDAWLPEYQSNMQGTSIILVRSVSISRLLMSAGAAQNLRLGPLRIERVVASQAGHVRRKRYLLAMRLGQPVDPVSGRQFSPSDRLTWWIQRRIQMRSKRVWARGGSAHDYQAFMRSVWVLRFLIMVGVKFSKIVAHCVRPRKATKV